MTFANCWCTVVYALYNQVTQDMGLHKRANTSSMKCTQIVTTASLCPYQSLEKHTIVTSKMQKQKNSDIKHYSKIYIIIAVKLKV